MQAKLGMIGDLPTSLCLVDSNSLQKLRSKSIYESPLCCQLLNVNNINSAIEPFLAKALYILKKILSCFYIYCIIKMKRNISNQTIVLRLIGKNLQHNRIIIVGKKIA